MKRSLLALFVVLLLSCMAKAQTTTLWFPEGHLFETIMLDPLEAQNSASLLKNSNGKLTHNGLYAPFSIGAKKAFIRWKTPNSSWMSELSLDIAAFTQFELYQEASAMRRRMLNVDYRVGLIYAIKKENHTTRIRLYHISSHLGDDYMISRGITSFFDNKVNYEQVDILHAIQQGSIRYYGGIGVGLRPFGERKPLSLQGGIFFKDHKATSKNIRMIAGLDMKLFQQTDFVPNLKMAWGYEFGNITNAISIVLEGYTGKLPYSPLEQENITWGGLGMYFKPF